MNTERIDHMIAVLTAYKEGKTIQFLPKEASGPAPWADCELPPAFNFATCNYRVKPEPRTIFVNEYPSGLAERSYFSSEKEADESAAPGRIACRKFVEVIEG